MVNSLGKVKGVQAFSLEVRGVKKLKIKNFVGAYGLNGRVIMLNQTTYMKRSAQPVINFGLWKNQRISRIENRINTYTNKLLIFAT